MYGCVILLYWLRKWQVRPAMLRHDDDVDEDVDDNVDDNVDDDDDNDGGEKQFLAGYQMALAPEWAN